MVPYGSLRFVRPRFTVALTVLAAIFTVCGARFYGMEEVFFGGFRTSGFTLARSVFRPLGEDRMDRIFGRVAAVSASAGHSFSKAGLDQIRLLEGLGVEGDAHMGRTVKHRSRVRADPSQPNLRQVHLIHQELLKELNEMGFDVGPGALGENVLTEGLDLLALPVDTVLKLGGEAEVRVTGLRNPCKQLDDYQAGLMAAVLDRDAEGRLIRKAGIMAVVLRGGPVRPRDRLAVEFPPGPGRPLAPI